jgi:hypothetical protein
MNVQTARWIDGANLEATAAPAVTVERQRASRAGLSAGNIGPDRATGARYVDHETTCRRFSVNLHQARLVDDGALMHAPVGVGGCRPHGLHERTAQGCDVPIDLARYRPQTSGLILGCPCLGGNLGNEQRHILHRGAALIDISCDLLRGRGLFLDRGRDRDGDLRNLIKRVADRFDLGDRRLGGRAQAADLLRNLLRRVRRLDGEPLHLAGNDGKSLAGLPGACRFDRRIQGQQIGLGRDVGDQPNNGADALGRRREGADRRLRLCAALRGVARDGARMHHLLGDFAMAAASCSLAEAITCAFCMA